MIIEPLPRTLKILKMAHHLLGGFAYEQSMRRANEPTWIAQVFGLGTIRDASVLFAYCISPYETGVMCYDDATSGKSVRQLVRIISIL
jgi:hypothetical protein